MDSPNIKPRPSNDINEVLRQVDGLHAMIDAGQATREQVDAAIIPIVETQLDQLWAEADGMRANLFAVLVAGPLAVDAPKFLKLCQLSTSIVVKELARRRMVARSGE